MSNKMTYKDFAKEYDVNKFFIGSQSKLSKGQHSKKVQEIALEISSEDNSINKDLLSVCSLMHDVGRILQDDIIGSFDDKIISHKALGIMLLDRFMTKHKIPAQKEFDILRLCIGYHGSQNLIYNTNTEYLKYNEYVSDADHIHNGCLSCVFYIPNEIKNDSKNYIKNNPHLNQKQVKPEIINFIREHKPFSKLSWVETYAEYVSYACSLAILMCDKYGAKVINLMNEQNGEYENSFIAYENMINLYIDKEPAKILLNELNKYRNFTN